MADPVQLQVPDIVEADQSRRSIGIPLHDGDRTVGLIEADPTPHRGVKHVANEPADHEVVCDQQLVPVVRSRDTEVFNSGPQRNGILIALVLGHAVEPGKPSVRSLTPLPGGGHWCSIRREYAVVSRHPREIAGDDIGRLGRPGQRAVVDGREWHRTQPPTQPVRLLAAEL